MRRLWFRQGSDAAAAGSLHPNGRSPHVAVLHKLVQRGPQEFIVTTITKHNFALQPKIVTLPR